MSNLIPIHLAEAAMAERDAEIARLKDELKMEKENEDRLVREWQRANNEVYGQRSQIAALIDNQTRLNSLIANSEQENARLKAEVERLEAFATRTIIPNEILQAEVERLTKAGDEMEKVIWLAECIAGVEHTEKSSLAWNAAKEGKQS